MRTPQVAAPWSEHGAETIYKNVGWLSEKIRSWDADTRTEASVMAEWADEAEALENACKVAYTRLFNYWNGMDELRDKDTTKRLNERAMAGIDKSLNCCGK